MADQKVVDKNATSIAKQYQKAITDIVETLMKAKGKVSDEEFITGLNELPIQDIVKSKMSSIEAEFTNAHKEVLETVTPFGKIKEND